MTTRNERSPILVEVGPGELLDKLTILHIKSERIADPEKLANIRHELEVLDASRREHVPDSDEITSLINELRTVNGALWEIEDDIRDCEAARDFGDKFIQLARAVYQTNDKRAAIKKAINVALDASIVEEKSYSDYSGTS